MSPTSFDIRQEAARIGVNLCGIANVERFTEAPKGHHPTDHLPGCRSVIVLACRFPLDQLDVQSETYTIARDNMDEKMARLATELAAWMNAQGMTALEIPPRRGGGYEADGRYYDPMSFKHAGYLAGLGRFGKNTLLINNRLGNMMWLSVVLTTAELTPDPLATYKVCSPTCHVCLAACTVNAFAESFIKQRTCFLHAYRMVSGREDGKTQIILCNACRVACPTACGVPNTAA